MVFRNWPRSYLSRSDGCLGQDEHITDAQKSRCFGRDIPLHRLFSQWQEKPMVLQKVVIEVSILELRNTNYWDDFAFGSSTRSGRWNRISQQLKKNGKITAVFTEKDHQRSSRSTNIASVWESGMFVIENNWLRTIDSHK
jgi:2-oxoisovalerate dehydrogenase E1 component